MKAGHRLYCTFSFFEREETAYDIFIILSKLD
jgi:hypothetical protein